jgi:voltage-dependent calcium channel
MRVYDGDFTVSRLIEDCSRVKRVSGLPVEGQQEQREIDLAKLNERLAELPVNEIRRRRARMNKFYEEVLVSSDPDRGIEFTSLLMILAHYKVINENRSLRLHEFLRRRALLQRVDEAVRRGIVIGFFDTVYWHGLFRRHMERKTAGVMTDVPQFTVPEIFVEHEEESGEPSAKRDHLDPFSANRPASPTSHVHRAVTPPEGSRTPTLRRGDSINSIQITPTTSPIRSRAGPLRRQRNSSDLGDGWHLDTLDIDEPVGGRSRAGSNVSAQDVLEVLDNSAWGESIRRSFSMRRPSRDDGRE